MSGLEVYRTQIAEFIESALSQFGPPSHLLSACLYALSSGGKRYRPVIVLMMTKALGLDADSRFAALCIELFHTASLVVDDLPAMDDDDLRRSKPSVHKKFGEGMALLVSYALIAEGYGSIQKNAALLAASSLPFADRAAEIGMLVLENATFNTGLNGATGGQFLDISPPNLSKETILDIIHKKTTSLFEISFVCGWLFGGGDVSQLPKVKKVASHFGLAFQLADDLGDREQDIKNGRTINYANLFGEAPAKELFHVELSSFISEMQALGIYTKDFQALVDEMSFKK